MKCCGHYLLKKPIQEIYISDPKKKYTGDKCKEHFYGVRPSSIPLIDAVMMDQFGKSDKKSCHENHKNKLKKCKKKKKTDNVFLIHRRMFFKWISQYRMTLTN